MKRGSPILVISLSLLMIGACGVGSIVSTAVDTTADQGMVAPIVPTHYVDWEDKTDMASFDLQFGIMGNVETPHPIIQVNQWDYGYSGTEEWTLTMASATVGQIDCPNFQNMTIQF